MVIDFPTHAQIPQLLELWKAAFGEHGGFWEMFLETAFSFRRCRCVTEGKTVTAALTWFDCSCAGQKLAYVYAVVTHPDHRGKGLCRTLLQDTHRHLKDRGYHAVLLVPEQPPLRRMYENMGYETCTAVSEFTCSASQHPAALRAIGPGEYARLRGTYLPHNAVIQEGENLDFLAEQVQFYAGENILMAAYVDDRVLYAMELLGNREAAPDITAALNGTQGRFRCPGVEKPFAMIHPLGEDVVVPAYFGFAFD